MFRKSQYKQHAVRRLMLPEQVRPLPAILWSFWTSAVVVTALIVWHTAQAQHTTIDLLGMAIHCFTVGVIGLVVLTKIEMWLTPEQFEE